VSAAPGYSGLLGRTLHAVALTYGDFVHQLLFELTLSGALESEAVPTLSFGGLRSGWARFAGGEFSLHDYSFVPGVTISGTIDNEGVELQVGGRSASHGSLRRGAHKALVGTVGGTHVVLSGSYVASAEATAAIVGSDARESSQADPDGSADGSAARRLDLLLGGVQP
jgi:hypothetical protein